MGEVIETKRLLVLDQENPLVEQLHARLAAQMTFTVVSSADHFWSEFEKRRPQVVAMHFQNQDSSRKQLIQDLHLRFPKVRIVLLTPAEDIPSYAEALSLKCFECIQKSSRIEDISRAIIDAFHQPLSQQERAAQKGQNAQPVQTSPGPSQSKEEPELRATFHSIANAVAVANGYAERSIKTLKKKNLTEADQTELMNHMNSIIQSLDLILEHREAYRKHRNSQN